MKFSEVTLFVCTAAVFSAGIAFAQLAVAKLVALLHASNSVAVSLNYYHNLQIYLPLLPCSDDCNKINQLAPSISFETINLDCSECNSACQSTSLSHVIGILADSKVHH
jgi:hypothetical protein